jgi:hypothetical protein
MLLFEFPQLSHETETGRSCPQDPAFPCQIKFCSHHFASILSSIPYLPPIDIKLSQIGH